MCRCDTCKVEESIRKSNEPACCAWYLDNVFIGGLSISQCPVYEPIESLQMMRSKLSPRLTGHVIRWIDSEQFIIAVTNRDGKIGEMIGHTEFWEIA